MISDAGEDIDQITWTVTGKVKTLTRTTGSLLPDVEFVYNVAGERIGKIEKPRDVNGPLDETYWIYTYYILDVSGNTIAVYEQTISNNTEGTEGYEFKKELKLKEQHIFGRRRIGLQGSDEVLVKQEWDIVLNGLYVNWQESGSLPAIEIMPDFTYPNIIKGDRQFELTEHRGNVLVTVSDRRLIVDLNSDGVDYFMADVVTACDYYPFGMAMPGRTFNNDLYRYGHQGQESVGEISGYPSTHYAYTYRMNDTRIGRFFSVDPLAFKYPHNSVYAFSENKVISHIELEGLEAVEPSEAKGQPVGIPKGVRPLPAPPNGVPISAPSGTSSPTAISLGAATRILGTGFLTIAGVLCPTAGNCPAPISAPINWAELGRPAPDQDGMDRPYTVEEHTQLVSNSRVDWFDDDELDAAMAEAGSRFAQGTATQFDIEVRNEYNRRYFSKWQAGPSDISDLNTRPHCVRTAKAIQAVEGGEYLYMTNNTPQPYQIKYLDTIKTPRGKIYAWAYHVAVVRDGMVFDDITGPDGMPLDAYKEMFDRESTDFKIITKEELDGIR